MENEQWLPAVGYEDRYEVSDLGRVRIISSGRVLAQTSSGRHAGYLTVELWRANRRRQRFVHSLVIRTFRGEAPTPAHRCAHDDGSRQNNILVNLLWKTMQENMDDREKHGRTARGQHHGKAKMTDAQAKAVKALLDRHGNVEIAALLGISAKSVDSIRGRRSWKHL